MNKSEHIGELAKALSLCQKEMTSAKKDSENPHFRSKYADLSAVWDAIREPLTKFGLSVVQTIEQIENKTTLVSLLMHESGQWIKSSLPIKTDKDTCQGWGSGITYARRYSLAALVGCVQDDDDGNGAEPDKKQKQEKAKQESKQISPPTEDQMAKIHTLCDLCDPEYISKILEWLEGKGIDSMNKINSYSLCETVISGMKKNAELYQGKI